MRRNLQECALCPIINVFGDGSPPRRTVPKHVETLPHSTLRTRLSRYTRRYFAGESPFAFRKTRLK